MPSLGKSEILCLPENRVERNKNQNEKVGQKEFLKKVDVSLVLV